MYTTIHTRVHHALRGPPGGYTHERISMALSSPFRRLRAWSLLRAKKGGPLSTLSSGWPAPHSPAPPHASPSLLARVLMRVAWWLRATRIACQITLWVSDRNGPPAGRALRGPRAKQGRPMRLWRMDLSAIASQLALRAAERNQFSLRLSRTARGQYPSRSAGREGILSCPRASAWSFNVARVRRPALGSRPLTRPREARRPLGRPPLTVLGGGEASREASRGG